MNPTGYEAVAAAAAALGLAARGAFHAAPGDGVPALPGGAATATVVLLGNVGPGMWRAFRDSPEFASAGHPLDRWSRRVVGQLARQFDAVPLHPFEGPPWLPFQRWAMRADAVWPSPIGALVHAQYGLWHAYRGALAFAGRMALPEREAREPPCLTCRDRPCLGACPVGAFSDAGYDVPACETHLRSGAGQACTSGGCLARHACPVGRAWRYAPEQAVFHMTAFLAARPASRA